MTSLGVADDVKASEDDDVARMVSDNDVTVVDEDDNNDDDDGGGGRLLEVAGGVEDVGSVLILGESEAWIEEGPLRGFEVDEDERRV